MSIMSWFKSNNEAPPPESPKEETSSSPRESPEESPVKQLVLSSSPATDSKGVERLRLVIAGGGGSWEDEAMARDSHAAVCDLVSVFGDNVFGDTPVLIPTGTHAASCSSTNVVEPDNTVLLILPFGKAPEVVMACAKAFKAKGFKIALPSELCSCAQSGLADFVVVRFGPNFESECAAASKEIPVIVTGIPDHSTADSSFSSGAYLVEGPYVSSPRPLRAKGLPVGSASLLEAAALARREAPATAIEEVLKRDAGAGVRLLKKANGAGNGLARPVQTYRDAIAVIGYDALARWFLVTAAVSNKGTPPASALCAIARGRFVEGAMRKSGPRNAMSAGQGFLAGVLSFSDALLGLPPSEALPLLGVGGDVYEAVVSSTGPLARWLDLARSVEEGRAEDAYTVSEQLGLGAQDVSRIRLESVGWASGVTADAP